MENGRVLGRPKGAVSPVNEQVRQKAAATGELPLAYMLRIMRDPSQPVGRRDEMAKAAALVALKREMAALRSQVNSDTTRAKVALSVNGSPSTRRPSSAKASDTPRDAIDRAFAEVGIAG